MEKSNVPIFILCGGMGTRIKEETEFRPKPMIPIGQHPILFHIMRIYAGHGFRKFVLCLGFKADFIKAWFRNFHLHNTDCTINMRTNEVREHETLHTLDWEVTLAYTGEQAMTGSRIEQATRKYLGDAEHFGVTYGDGVTDADLSAEFTFHLNHGKIGTVLGVNPPARFGEISLDGETVLEFAEKPQITNKWINGGFFFFRRDFTRYLNGSEDTVLEREPLMDLSRDRELKLYQHGGFWACMDTQRDRDALTAMVEKGTAPWLKQ